MDAIPQFSFSRVTTFEQCPRRYRYRYLDGVKEGFRSIEGFMGQQVHAALEWLYVERAAGREHDSAELVARYCELWDEAIATPGAPVRVIREDKNSEFYRRTGAELASDFHRSRFVGDPLETVATEQHFQVVIGGLFRFQGFIDRLAKDAEGCIHIIDFKTGSRTPARFEGKDAEQLEAYAVALFQLEEHESLELRLEYLRSGRTVGRRIERSDVAEIERRLAARIECATSATVFPANVGTLCGWCGFNDLCEAYSLRGRRPRRR